MIDLRSDLVSVPTDAMWEAMRTAELGWATFGEDASVNALCERVAALLGETPLVFTTIELLQGDKLFWRPYDGDLEH